MFTNLRSTTIGGIEGATTANAFVQQQSKFDSTLRSNINDYVKPLGDLDFGGSKYIAKTYWSSYSFSVITIPFQEVYNDIYGITTVYDTTDNISDYIYISIPGTYRIRCTLRTYIREPNVPYTQVVGAGTIGAVIATYASAKTGWHTYDYTTESIGTMKSAGTIDNQCIYAETDAIDTLIELPYGRCTLKFQPYPVLGKELVVDIGSVVLIEKIK